MILPANGEICHTVKTAVFKDVLQEISTTLASIDYVQRNNVNKGVLNHFEHVVKLLSSNVFYCFTIFGRSAVHFAFFVISR